MSIPDSEAKKEWKKAVTGHPLAQGERGAASTAKGTQHTANL